MLVDCVYRQKDAYWFSVTPLSKWLPGGHIVFLSCQLQTSIAQYLCVWIGAFWFSVTSFSKWPSGSHIGFFFSEPVCRCHGLQSIIQIGFQISISNFIWYAYCVRLWTEAYWFSMISLSKWPPNGHIEFFYILTLWANIRSKIQWYIIFMYG